jgi:hypothetical protein
MFKMNCKYTVYRISDFMAMTTGQRITVKEIRDNGETIVYQPQGKRKLYMLRMHWQSYTNGPVNEFDGAVFEGWDTPYTCDTDSDRNGEGIRTMRGNACYNFVGPADKIREWIDAKQLNPKFTKANVLAIEGDTEVVVYPEHTRPGAHAVIDRVMKTQEENTPAAASAAA